MSYNFQVMKNKRQKYSEVRFHQYMANCDEPRDSVFRDTQSSLEVELIEDSHFMRQQFRQAAQRLRSQKS